jgi:DNA polymerase III subunit gamma/tau
MENFIVSARKYRPKTFDTVVAQNSITSTLKNAIKNKQLAQAFLFCGPRGVGKTTCARILAKTINCENLSDNIEPCGECAPCRSFNEYASFNIHELDAASNNSVDDIRSLVDQVRVPPQVGKYKVYIIDEVHMLSAQAFNAFLKTLEEPPAYAKFILATTEKHKIIPTILSRCQIYDFKRISVDDIAKYLNYVAINENVEADPDALHIIAIKADGAMRDALTIFDQLVSFSGKSISYQNVLDNLNVLDYDYFFQMTDYVYSGNISGSLLLLDKVIDKGFDGQHFIVGFGEHLRNLLVCKDPVTVSLLEVSPGVRDKYKEQAERCEAACMLKGLEIINKCDINYKLSNNKRLSLELALMQLCSIKQTVQDKPASNIKPSTSELRLPASELSKVKEPEIKSTIKSDSTEKSTSKQPEIIKSKIISINPKSLDSGSQPPPSNLQPQTSDFGPQTSDFTEEKLMMVWKAYAERIARSQPGFYSTLTKYSPVLKEDFKIQLILDNAAQNEELKEKKMDMLGYLRKELKNYKIDIDTSINEIPRVDKPYTNSEKFNRMNEKNPNLGKLKTQLGLDID